MPGTPDEYLRYAVAEHGPWPLRWDDGSEVTTADRIDLNAIRAYRQRQLAYKHRDRRPQQKAMRLLRKFLSASQRTQLKRGKAFVVVAPSGHAYRLHPKTGSVAQVTTHGRRQFAAVRYCLHDDPEGKMPPADLSLAHMLLLLSDEAAFLATANFRTARDQLWNGEYLRRMRRREPRTEATFA